MLHPTAGDDRNAGEVGQTAGSFGKKLSTIADAGKPQPSPPEFEPAALNAAWEGFVQHLRENFPGLELKVLPVSAIDLPDRFSRVASPQELPDAVLGGVPAAQLRQSGAVTSLAALGTVISEDVPPPGQPVGVRGWAIVAQARHPEEARAFVVWVQDGLRAHAERLGERPPEAEAPSLVAAGAVHNLLQGVPLGTLADPSMATFSPLLASADALSPPSREALGGFQIRTDILDARANARFAVISVRAIVSAPGAFGVTHSLVVLRRGDDRHWRVLHISGNVSGDALAEDFAAMKEEVREVAPEKLKPVSAITQAAPVDGDSRTGVPELYWDNSGDAPLLIVEWQRDSGPPHLFFVPDREARLQVRVTAAFARQPDVYRWRVWSLAPGGLVKLSGWRRLTVLP